MNCPEELSGGTLPGRNEVAGDSTGEKRFPDGRSPDWMRGGRGRRGDCSSAWPRTQPRSVEVRRDGEFRLDRLPAASRVLLPNG
jgi:hypothetical protein